MSSIQLLEPPPVQHPFDRRPNKGGPGLAFEGGRFVQFVQKRLVDGDLG